MKTKSLSSLLIALVWTCFFQAAAQAPFPAVDLRPVSALIERDFDSIDSIHTVGMTDEDDGRFDLIVVGRKPRSLGWRVEVLSVAHHSVSKLWDSAVSATEPEYSMSGPKSVSLAITEYDYDLVIEGCAPHLCSDGVSGYLIFHGKAESTVKARVMSTDLDKAYTPKPGFNVTFSKDADDRSKLELKRAICRSPAIGNKSGLPFNCDVP